MMKENRDALLYFRLNCVMLLIVTVLFYGGVFSVYQSYRKYGVEYEVITIINGIETIEIQSILVDSMFVLLFSMFVIVSFLNCKMFGFINEFMNVMEIERNERKKDSL